MLLAVDHPQVALLVGAKHDVCVPRRAGAIGQQGDAARGDIEIRAAPVLVARWRCRNPAAPASPGEAHEALAEVVVWRRRRGAIGVVKGAVAGGQVQAAARNPPPAPRLTSRCRRQCRLAYR